MRNPFQYGSVVSGSAFCNRQEEQRDLRRAAENAEKLFVYSERRLGTDSETYFVGQTVNAIASTRNKLYRRLSRVMLSV